jgi:hypothetical protein
MTKKMHKILTAQLVGVPRHVGKTYIADNNLQQIRQGIILALDDEDGINVHAMDKFWEVCKEFDWTDINEAVESQDDRYYLPEHKAKKLYDKTILLSKQSN